ncbi:HORMA domain-containing protein [Plectosphaerella plurivora]|uniref:HORMA domain-containing protein n=1 Tax=Plectosphaerella plurivora TaxID=936078 RepID=A0A9P8V4N9_9PEZI|nr:HORMA domain-containing protein [Plectosphaerella plurivora]
MSSSISPSSGEAIPIPQARTLLTTFTTFLTLSVHTILYHRQIYPPESFLLARFHNLPVRQCRHPGLCAWINDSLTQVRALLASAQLSRVCVNIHHRRGLAVIERWVFDVSSFPAWIDDEAERARLAEAAAKGKGKERPRPVTWEERERREQRPRRMTEAERDELERGGAVNWVDVDEAMRGALRRVAYAAEKKGAAEEGCTFTIAVELKDGAQPPLGSEHWIPSQPDQQPPGTDDALPPPSTPGDKSTTPLRTVTAGPLFFECWIEENAVPVPDKTPTNVDFGTQDSEYP